MSRTVLASMCSVLVVAAVAGSAAAQVVINEVDYDQIGTDSAEFIELYNAGGTSIYLGDLSLVLVNGANNATYLVIPLSPRWLGPGQYWVVAGNSGLVSGATQILPTAANWIQNGAPDGIALVDNRAVLLLDSLSYEGCMTATAVTGLPGFTNLVEGSCLSASVADDNVTSGLGLSRTPNGHDINDAATDWALAAITPGTKNGSTCTGPFAAPVSPSLIQTCPTGGSDVTITVTPIGPGPFFFQWRKDGVALSNNATYGGVQTDTLSVIAPGAIEAGIYDCVVTNPCAPMLSDATTIQTCIADVNCQDGIDLADFFYFLNCFDQSLDCADIDGQAGVDLGDFFTFLNAFDQGC